MQKNHTCKILAVGIIILFIGVSVSSGFTVDDKQSIRVNQNEECGDCRELTDDVPFPILCNIFKTLFESLEPILYKINDIWNKYPNLPDIIDNTLTNIWVTIGFIGIMYMSFCGINPYPPL